MAVHDQEALAPAQVADIEAGKVDCIVVYRVDRLSRSLIDFSKIMDVLERHKVSFVSGSFIQPPVSKADHI